MIAVLLRELSSLPLLKKGKWLSKLTQIGLTLVGLAAFITLECFIYCQAFDKFSAYKGVNSSLTAIVLFLIFLASIIYLLPKASACFFNPNERAVLCPLPIDNGSIFYAKSVYSYLLAFAFHCFLSLPILLCFGLKYGSLFVFYIIAFLYVVFIAAMTVGATFLLAFPFYVFSNFIKRNSLVLLVLSFVIMLGLTAFYAYVLNLFVALVSGNSIDSLLSNASVTVLSDIGDSLYPFITVIRMAGRGASWEYMLVLFLVPLSVYALSMPILYFAFTRFMKNPPADMSKRKKVLIKPVSRPLPALIKKEFLVLTSSADGIFSFFPLVLASPFLIVSVVVAVDAIFHLGNLNYVLTLFPGFPFFIEIALVFLFLSVINGSGGLSLHKEGRQIILMKTFPLAGRAQLTIKIMVPLLWSSLSFFAAALSLAILGNLSWPQFGYVLTAGLIYLSWIYLNYILSELRYGSASAGFSSLFSFLMPFLLSGLPALMTLLDYSYADLPYAMMLSLSALLFLPTLAIFLFRGERLFLSYEGRRL